MGNSLAFPIHLCPLPRHTTVPAVCSASSNHVTQGQACEWGAKRKKEVQSRPEEQVEASKRGTGPKVCSAPGLIPFSMAVHTCLSSLSLSGLLLCPRLPNDYLTETFTSYKAFPWTSHDLTLDSLGPCIQLHTVPPVSQGATDSARSLFLQYCVIRRLSSRSSSGRVSSALMSFLRVNPSGRPLEQKSR